MCQDFPFINISLLEQEARHLSVLTTFSLVHDFRGLHFQRLHLPSYVPMQVITCVVGKGWLRRKLKPLRELKGSAVRMREAHF